MAEPAAITLLAPPPAHASGALTGGYEYNRQIASALNADGGSPACYRWVAADILAAHLSTSSGPRHTTLIDSLFLAERLALPRRPQSPPVALLCHVVPWELWPDGGSVSDLSWLAGAITTSDATAAAAVEGLRLRGCNGPVLAVSPGVDLDRFTPAEAVQPVEPAGVELLTVANVRRDKGHLHLLEVLAQLSHHRWTWRIVGDLSQEPETVRALRRQAAACGVEERVQLVGSIAGTDLVACYRSAELAVFPTFRESYGMAIVEALACGLPVLASDIGGVAEAVGGSDAARLLPAGDKAAWLEALDEIMAGTGRRSRMAAAARAQRRRLRSWQEAAAALRSATRQLLILPAGTA